MPATRGVPARSPDQLPEQALERVVQRAYLQQADAEIKASNAGITPPAAPAVEIKASKAAKSLAEAAGVDLAKVVGTGADGAITKPDVEAFIEAQKSAQE